MKNKKLVANFEKMLFQSLSTTKVMRYMTSKSTLNLRQFMLRHEVLKLYKNILKTIREVPDQKDQKYLLEWARKDFKDHKHETDEYVIKSYMKTGEAILNELKLSLKMSN